LILDHKVKQVDEVPIQHIQQNHNIYSHNKHHLKTKIPDHDNQINQVVDRLIFDSGTDQIKSMDDTDKFIFLNMQKHNDKYNPKFNVN